MSKAELVAAVQKSLGKETSSAQANRTVDESVKKSGVPNQPHTTSCRSLTLNREAHPGLQTPPGRA